MQPMGRQIIQTAYVVNDIAEAAARWNKATGIGPFLVTRDVNIAQPFYRGQPRRTRFSVALAQAGPVQVELIQRLDDGPSCYSDTIAPGTEGFHHVAVLVEDYAAEVARYEAAGYQVASGGLFGDMRFCYVDTAADIGCMVEIVEDKPAIRAFFGAVIKAANSWDGTSQLLRELG